MFVCVRVWPQQKSPDLTDITVWSIPPPPLTHTLFFCQCKPVLCVSKMNLKKTWPMNFCLIIKCNCGLWETLPQWFFFFFTCLHLDEGELSCELSCLQFPFCDWVDLCFSIWCRKSFTLYFLFVFRLSKQNTLFINLSVVIHTEHVCL